MSKATPFLLVLTVCCLTPITRAHPEDIHSPNGAYAIRMERNESLDGSPFPYRGARLVNVPTGRVIQTLRPDDDLDYNEISVLWSPDSTLVAVYYVHKYNGRADVYRVGDGKAVLLESPDYALPAKSELDQPFRSRFAERKPSRWLPTGILVLECSGRVQLQSPKGEPLPEWMDYEYEVQLQFGKNGKSLFKQAKLISSARESEPEP